MSTTPTARSAWAIQGQIVAEKVGLAFAVAYVTALLALKGDVLHVQPYVAALDTALWTALIALASALLLVLTGIQKNLTPWGDAGVRVLMQFIQVFSGFMIASTVTSVVHTNWKGAVAAAIAGTLPTLLKVLVAVHLPTTQASIVPVGTTVDQPPLPAAA